MPASQSPAQSRTPGGKGISHPDCLDSVRTLGYGPSFNLLCVSLTLDCALVLSPTKCELEAGREYFSGLWPCLVLVYALFSCSTAPGKLAYTCMHYAHIPSPSNARDNFRTFSEHHLHDIRLHVSAPAPNSSISSSAICSHQIWISFYMSVFLTYPDR